MKSSQTRNAPREGAESSPIARRCTAMIARAILDLQRPGLIGRQARDWLVLNDRQALSFLWCCDVLTLAPERFTKSALVGRRSTASEFY